MSIPTFSPVDGGYTVNEVATRDEALHWAQKIAMSCRCPHVVGEFMHDPES